jgi:lysozyme
MRASKNCIDLIKRFEGLKLESYLCPAKIWTIGYGHTGKTVIEGLKITETEAEMLLGIDLDRFERFLNGLYLRLNQNQFDALISFIYNIGNGNFLKSTMLKKIKIDPDDLSIRIEFNKWTKAKGKTLTGLITRRNAEAELYFKDVIPNKL